MGTYQLRGSVCSIIACVLTLIVIAFTAASYQSSPESFLSHTTQNWTFDPLEHTQNATLGFQKIFALNLPSRTDHRDSLSLAASLTGLKVTYIEGVTSVNRKTLPLGGEEAGLTDAELGNWRAHLNAAREMVENNIQSALILEDDADWDIRIKAQMRNYAKATRLLMQPIAGTTDRYLDPTFPDGHTEEQNPLPVELYIDQAFVSEPSDSPYGDTDRWDLLWIGHCGMQFPHHESSPHISQGRALILNDETVPEKQHVRMQFGDDTLINTYPDHTRAVSRAYRNLCTLGYALTLNGARKLLYELSISHMNGQTDVDLGAFCNGNDETGAPAHMCFSVQPQLFQHHRPIAKKSSFSDISGHNDAMNEHAFTRNVRWSTRMNLEKLINGKTDYIDLWQDGKEDEFDYGFSRKS